MYKWTIQIYYKSYEFFVMPFGLCSIVATFMTIMNDIFDVEWTNVGCTTRHSLNLKGCCYRCKCLNILNLTKNLRCIWILVVPPLGSVWESLSRTSPWGVPETPWAQEGPRGDTQDLWCRWWEGPGRWERLPPTETRMHKGKVISYV